MSKLRTLMALVAVGAMIALAVGCNTVEGMGKDIEGTGEAIQRVAD